MMLRIYLPKLIQDFLRWKPDVAFLIGLWTGLAICCIISNVTARVILKLRICPECGKRMGLANTQEGLAKIEENDE